MLTDDVCEKVALEEKDLLGSSYMEEFVLYALTRGCWIITFGNGVGQCLAMVLGVLLNGKLHTRTFRI